MNTSLPYIDAIDEEHERRALELIEAEMQCRTRPAVPPMPPSILEHKMHNQGPKYSPSEALKPPNDDATVEEWEEAVRKARIAYEHERIKGIQLSVDNTAAPPVFRALNATLCAPRTEAFERKQQEQTTVVQQVNYERQRHQQDVVGPEMRALQAQCWDLVEKQRQLRQAIQELEEKSGI